MLTMPPVPPAIVFAAPYRPFAAVAPADHKAEALRWLNKAVAASNNPNEAGQLTIQLDLAHIYHQIGDELAAQSALSKAHDLVTEKNFPAMLHLMAEGGEYDAAAAFAKEKKIDDAWGYADIADSQIAAKDPGAKATLMQALAKGPALEDALERNALEQESAAALIKIGAKTEAKATLAQARTELAKFDDIFRGISKMRRLVDNARSMRLVGDPAQDRLILADVEKTATKSLGTYSKNDVGTIYFEIAAEYRALGDTVKADALCKKAAPMIVTIEADGNEQELYQLALNKQAAAGQIAEAVAHAKKGEYKVAPSDALQGIGEELGKAGNPAGAKTVFAEARAVIGKEPVAGKRMYALMDLAPAMAKAGDRAGAIAVFQQIAAGIPKIPEKTVQDAFWAQLVKRYAAVDLPAAVAYIDKVDPKWYRELFFDFAKVEAKAYVDGKKA